MKKMMSRKRMRLSQLKKQNCQMLKFKPKAWHIHWKIRKYKKNKLKDQEQRNRAEQVITMLWKMP
jgi:hypothetical protein